MIKELKDLLDEVALVRDQDIKEPDLEVGLLHNVVGKIDDIEMKRMFNLYVLRVNQLDGIHQTIKGLEQVTGGIPVTIRAKMAELQDEIDLLRNIFFYAIGKQFNLFDRNFIYVHKGWLVSWSNSNQPLTVFPNLGNLANDDDDDGN